MLSFKTSRYLLIIALILPILALLLMTQTKQQHLQQGTEITLPIIGFDPRDLLSGHYLIYSIDYGVNTDCEQEHHGSAWMCLQPQPYFYQHKHKLQASGCQTWISGECKAGDFRAGIERFYIPEEYARTLDQLIRGQKGKITLSVDKNGEALVKELLINDQPWKEMLQAQENKP